MTDSLARLLGLPFAIVLIIIFSTGGIEDFGIKTVLILVSLTALVLIYVFSRQIDIWGWRRRKPSLERPLKSWIQLHSKFYRSLKTNEKELLEGRIATLNRIKNFTLKGKRDYQLEEDVKTIISHEFARLTLGRQDFMYDGYDQFIVYNHPFGSPKIESLHTLELYEEDGVIILSKEQLINGFLDSSRYVNIGLLAAVMTFIHLNPRLDYPEVLTLELEDIAKVHNIQLKAIFNTLGTDWINRLDLMVFCYFLNPKLTIEAYPKRYLKLEKIFSEAE